MRERCEAVEEEVARVEAAIAELEHRLARIRRKRNCGR